MKAACVRQKHLRERFELETEKKLKEGPPPPAYEHPPSYEEATGGSRNLKFPDGQFVIYI